MIFWLLACAAPKTAPPAPLVAPYGWMVGSWTDAYLTESVASEAWWGGGDALLGVSFVVEAGKTRSFEVMVIEAVDGRLRFRANPDTQPEAIFPAVTPSDARLRFENPQHDYPTSIEYVRTREGLHAAIAGPGGARPYAWDFVAQPAETAPVLEAADRAFASAARTEKAAAWRDVWDPAGQLVRDVRVVGPEAVEEALAEDYANGLDLRWEPRTSGLSSPGDLGFTAGTWTARVRGKPAGTGTYVTIWRKQPDGAWKAAFDVGSDAP